MLDKNREQQYTNRAVRECSDADWIACGLVAQLDRVFDYESKGRGFESRRAHQNETLILIPRLAFFSCVEKPCPIRLFTRCRVKTLLALLLWVGARGVFFCDFQFYHILRLLAGCKIKRQLPATVLFSAPNPSAVLEFVFIKQTWYDSSIKGVTHALRVK